MRSAFARTLIPVLLCFWSAVQAQAWPESPVTIVIPNSPGALPDIIGRMMANHLDRSYNKRFLIDNRAGGAGLIAAQLVANAKPNGYTLFLAGSVIQAGNPHLFKTLPYDTERDFTPIATVIESAPLVLAVHRDVAASTLSELIALAKANPGGLSNATAGNLPPMVGEVFNKIAGVEILLARYKDTGTAMQDTAAGRTSMTMNGVTNVEPFVRDGRMRMIAIVSARRFPTLPNVPAVEETYPEIALDGWFTLLGPAGLSGEIVQSLNRSVDVFLKDPETVRRLHALGATTRSAQTPEATAAFIRTEKARWGRILKLINVKPQ
ncbi:MAG: tripartite tricarboxylate transporter substrate binding protein [Betaproteobacteria bacterium]|nr:tripartite tricarboxylate transporter substrate binding protein [Betaproteobacteria bacterium]